jgi:hypothetical protein
MQEWITAQWFFTDVTQGKGPGERVLLAVCHELRFVDQWPVISTNA